jgi:hypothetical protein
MEDCGCLPCIPLHRPRWTKASLDDFGLRDGSLYDVRCHHRLPNITPRRWPGIDLFLVLIHALLPTWVSRCQLPLWRRNRPQELRIHLSAIGTASHWISNFVIAEVTPIAFTSIGYRYYIVYHALGCRCSHGVFLVTCDQRKIPGGDGQNILEPEHWWKVAPAARRLPRSGLQDVENFEEENEKTKQVEEA